MKLKLLSWEEIRWGRIRLKPKQEDCEGCGEKSFLEGKWIVCIWLEILQMSFGPATEMSL